LYFSGWAAYSLGYFAIGPVVFAQQDANLNAIAKAAAQARENHGRPKPGTSCETETGDGGGKARMPPSGPVGADDEDPGLNPSRTPVFRGGRDMTVRPGE
jgi:hypothetical protein